MQNAGNDTNILIVDDEIGVRDSMHEFIEMAGFRSTIASSAEEAIDLLKKNNIQVVITDIMLPGMGGLELTKLIKRPNRPTKQAKNRNGTKTLQLLPT